MFYLFCLFHANRELISVLVDKRHQSLMTKCTRRQSQNRRELIAFLLVLHNHRVNLLDNIGIVARIDNLLTVLSLLDHSHQNRIDNIIRRQLIAILLPRMQL